MADEDDATPALSTPHALRLPSIDALRAFEAAARLGSMERAADALCITASAVGKRLGTLEELLGTPLLQRGARALALTAAGRDYLPQVRQALALLAAMPQHRREAVRPRVRLSTPPTFARRILVPHLEALAQALPDIEVEVVLSIPYLDTNAPEADVEVRAGDPSLAPPGSQRLLHDRVLPVAAPTLIERCGPFAQASDLLHAPLLRTPLEPWQPWFRAAGLGQAAEPRAGPRLLDLGLTLEAALAGQGVALARPSLARTWLESGLLRPVSRLSVATRMPYLLGPVARSEAPQAVAEWLRQRAQEAEAASRAWIDAL